jgi:succinate dehydrogenase / fumarate reductase cytochrome b subunit
MSEISKVRPEFRNIHALTDLPTYRLPAAGWVSILHRVSGALMFILLPFVIWMFDVSVSSEISFTRLTGAFAEGVWLRSASGEPGLGLPGWLLKLVALGLVWAYLHHLIAGLRHLHMDVNHAVGKEFGHASAVVTLVLSVALALALGLKLFGAY